MTRNVTSLEVHRDVLQREILDRDLDLRGNYQKVDKATTAILANYAEAERLIKAWWKAYKLWEATDTFNRAVQDDRMTVRSFGSDFKFNLTKTQPAKISGGRFYDADRQKTTDPTELKAHETAYAAMNLPEHKRGIDTSPYANPANFASRKAKFDAGLHDLSVTLVKKGADIKASCHHAAQANPHFVFLPLSKSEDQAEHRDETTCLLKQIGNTGERDPSRRSSFREQHARRK